MGFLDSKEEMMQIILTDHGRSLLSKGKFNIRYYSFSDDEVDYQPLYDASGSIGEDLD